MEFMQQERWIKLSIDTHEYMLKFYTNNKSYKLVLFDFNNVKLYSNETNSKEIEQTLNELNPSIEAPIDKICQHLKHSFINSKENKFSINDQTLKVESNLAGIRLKWIFDLEQLDSKSLKDCLLIPIFMYTNEYQARESELIKLLINKDKQIDDYKSQGCKLNRKYLETEVFNIQKFDLNMKNATQGEEIIQYPLDCFFNEKHQIIHESCAQKYYCKLKHEVNNLDKTKTSEQIIESIFEMKQSIEPTITKQDKSSAKELKQKLVEDNAKKQEKHKKKRIF